MAEKFQNISEKGFTTGLAGMWHNQAVSWPVLLVPLTIADAIIKNESGIGLSKH